MTRRMPFFAAKKSQESRNLSAPHESRKKGWTKGSQLRCSQQCPQERLSLWEDRTTMKLQELIVNSKVGYSLRFLGIIFSIQSPSGLLMISIQKGSSNNAANTHPPKQGNQWQSFNQPEVLSVGDWARSCEAKTKPQDLSRSWRLLTASCSMIQDEFNRQIKQEPWRGDHFLASFFGNVDPFF